MYNEYFIISNLFGKDNAKNKKKKKLYHRQHAFQIITWSCVHFHAQLISTCLILLYLYLASLDQSIDDGLSVSFAIEYVVCLLKSKQQPTASSQKCCSSEALHLHCVENSRETNVRSSSAGSTHSCPSYTYVAKMLTVLFSCSLKTLFKLQNYFISLQFCQRISQHQNQMNEKQKSVSG